MNYHIGRLPTTPNGTKVAVGTISTIAYTSPTLPTALQTYISAVRDTFLPHALAMSTPEEVCASSREDCAQAYYDFMYNDRRILQHEREKYAPDLRGDLVFPAGETAYDFVREGCLYQNKIIRVPTHLLYLETLRPKFSYCEVRPRFPNGEVGHVIGYIYEKQEYAA